MNTGTPRLKELLSIISSRTRLILAGKASLTDEACTAAKEELSGMAVHLATKVVEYESVGVQFDENTNAEDLAKRLCCAYWSRPDSTFDELIWNKTDEGVKEDWRRVAASLLKGTGLGSQAA